MRPLHRLAREAAQSASAEAIRERAAAALKAALERRPGPRARRRQDRAGASDSRDALPALRQDGAVRDRARRSPRAGRSPCPTRCTSTEIVPGRAEQHGIASALFVPVAWGDEVRSVIILGWSERREIAAEDIAAAELAADSAAAGLARLEAEARRAAGSVQDRASCAPAAR